MLVLTRHKGERVVIGPPENPIGYVSVEAVREGKVRLGFHFPTSVPVNREELVKPGGRGVGMWVDAPSRMICLGESCNRRIVEDERVLRVEDSTGFVYLCRACGEKRIGGTA